MGRGRRRGRTNLLTASCLVLLEVPGAEVEQKSESVIRCKFFVLIFIFL